MPSKMLSSCAVLRRMYSSITSSCIFHLIGLEKANFEPTTFQTRPKRQTNTTSSIHRTHFNISNRIDFLQLSVKFVKWNTTEKLSYCLCLYSVSYIEIHEYKTGIIMLINIFHFFSLVSFVQKKMHVELLILQLTTKQVNITIAIYYCVWKLNKSFKVIMCWRNDGKMYTENSFGSTFWFETQKLSLQLLSVFILAEFFFCCSANCYVFFHFVHFEIMEILSNENSVALR